MLNSITAIIVTYNSSQTVIGLLNSLNSAENLELLKEVIIIENNSPDRKITIEKINKYIESSKIKIRIIFSKKNRGFATSCNLGAKHAKTKYLLFINPDTRVKRHSLAVLCKHANQYNADIIGGISRNNTNEIHKTVVRIPDLKTAVFEFTNIGKFLKIRNEHIKFYYEDLNIYKEKNDIPVDAIGGAYLMVKRSSFERLNGFDQQFFMYLEDVDLGLRAKQAGMKVIFCPHSSIYHIGGASSNNRNHIIYQAWYDSRKYFYKKHYGKFINLIIQPLFSMEELLLKIRESVT